MNLGEVKRNFTNKYAIALLCAFFNVLCVEFWVRGIYFFTKSQFFFPFDSIIGLFANYFIYFLFVDYLIIKFRLKDYHILLVGIIYGFVMEIYFTQAQNYYADILSFLFYTITINLVWWGLIQTDLACYFANRLVKREIKDLKPNNFSWIIFISFNAISILFSRIFITPIIINSLFLFIISNLVLILLIVLLFFSIKKFKPSVSDFKKVTLFDIILIIFFCFPIIITLAFPTTEGIISVINTVLHPIGMETALWAFWIAFFIIIIWRVYKKQEIPIKNLIE
ncbi:MAG: hypothetical protein ACFFCM_11865 [Promethearchaeota archaeon]